MRPNSAETSEPACVSENIVDEEQHVLAFLIAEIFGE
jgi:hypothetical protein